MKKWTLLTGALALTLSQTTLSAGTHAVSGPGSLPASLSLHVGQTPLQDEQTQTVSIIEAMQTRGKVLPVVLGVAAVDIALATYFWGVYVPFYAEKEPAH